MFPGAATPLAFGGLISQLPLTAMLVAALVLRRSLGAWPVYSGALATALVTTLTNAPPDGSEAEILAALELGLVYGLPPTVLFLLARRQWLPGLRRGAMTEAERQRWLAQRAFSEVRWNGLNAQRRPLPNRVRLR